MGERLTRWEAGKTTQQRLYDSAWDLVKALLVASLLWIAGVTSGVITKADPWVTYFAWGVIAGIAGIILIAGSILLFGSGRKLLAWLVLAPFIAIFAAAFHYSVFSVAWSAIYHGAILAMLALGTVGAIVIFILLERHERRSSSGPRE